MNNLIELARKGFEEKFSGHGPDKDEKGHYRSDYYEDQWCEWIRAMQICSKIVANQCISIVDNDVLATSCQTLGQYRTAVKKEIETTFENVLNRTKRL